MAYPFAAMTCRHFELQIEYILILFSSIQSIRMYLKTSFGISTLYYTGTSDRPFQGGIQESSYAEANWILITIFLVYYLYSKKMILISKTPISQMCYQIASLLYVDDTDLPLHNKGNESVVEIVARA